MDEIWISLFSTGIWAVIKAAALLLLAFLAAAVVRSLVVKLFAKTKLSDVVGQKDDDGKNRMAGFVGKLAYLLVFLLFVPGIFESLGMDGVSMPILNLLDTMWGYVPNLLAAAIVLWIGFFAAKLIREILTSALEKVKIDRLQSIAGIEAEGAARLSNTLAYIVYVLVLIPVIIAALQALDIEAVSEPAIKMLHIIFGFIPNLFVALVVIVVGCMLARLAGSVVENLTASSGLDAGVSKLLGGGNRSFLLSKVIGKTVHAVTVLFFVVEGFGVLHLQVLNNIGNAIIGYLPYVLAAVLIMAACFVCNAALQNLLQKRGRASYALLCKCIIYTVGGFMVLNELGISPEIVNITFVLIVAAAAFAFAVAFGVGGRDFAAGILKKLEDRCSREREEER